MTGPVEIMPMSEPALASFLSLHDGGGKLVFSIEADGSVRTGEGFTPDEAGRRAAEIFAEHCALLFALDFAAEREACAKIAETFILGEDANGEVVYASEIASAIRARGQEPKA